MIKNRLNKLMVVMAAILISSTSYAQNSEYRLGIGLNGGLREYNGDLGSAMFMARGTKYGGGGIDLGYYLSPSLNIMAWGSTGDVGYNTYLHDEVDPYKLRIFNTRTAEFNFGVKYKFNNGKILNEDALVAPFLQVGTGVFYGHGSVSFNPSAYTVWSGNFAGGAGVDFNLNPRWSVRLQSIYNYTQNDIWDGEAGTTNHAITNRLKSSHDGYLYTSLGVVYNFNAFGLSGSSGGGKSLKKVRDDDNDGIENKYDKCKNTPEGCEVDSVGCPIDTDGDGVIDCEDKCPKVAGDPENGGCPTITEDVKEEINLAAKGILFESGKDVIRESSYENLDKLAEILNQYKEAKIAIEGHTDSQGESSFNLSLSQARANSVLKYLASKGVESSRMTATGYGDTNPKASNETADGRALNRRVDFILSY